MTEKDFSIELNSSYYIKIDDININYIDFKYPDALDIRDLINKSQDESDETLGTALSNLVISNQLSGLTPNFFAQELSFNDSMELYTKFLEKILSTKDSKINVSGDETLITLTNPIQVGTEVYKELHFRKLHNGGDATFMLNNAKKPPADLNINLITRLNIEKIGKSQLLSMTSNDFMALAEVMGKQISNS